VNLRNSDTSWGSVAKLFHWLVFALLIIQLSIGALIYSLDLYVKEDVDTYMRWIPTHKSVGLTILLLMLCRLGWRLSQTRPAWPAEMPTWQRRAAYFNHALLYGLLILQPLLGLTQSSAYGATTTFWGLFEVPSIVPEIWSRPNTDVVRLGAQDAHSWVAVLLVASVAVHIGAALRHRWVTRDQVLARMLPAFRGR